MNLSALFDRRPLGMRLGLAHVARAWDELGAPGQGIAAIHVVGTNGKGSTAAMAAHALSRRGRRVGRYTSPHLRRVGERIAIDGVGIDDDAVAAYVDRVLAIEGALDLPRPLTFFELLTLAALLAFSDAKVDAMVIEAGLGGRLDATRVVPPRVTAVTAIAIDHAAILGDTLTKIAAEKAAVMRPGVPVVSAPQPPEVLAVLRDRAALVGTTLHVVDPLARAPIGLPGRHQAENAAVALAAARVIDPGIDATDLDGVQWPGRAETIAIARGSLLLDAAHNPAGIDAIVQHLRDGTTRIDRIVFACMPDKDAPRMLQSLRTLGVPIIGTIADPDDAATLPAAVDPVLDRATLWPTIDAWLQAGDHVLVCGSIRLIGHIRSAALGEPPIEPQDPVPR